VELADTSVWARRRQPEIRNWFEVAFVEGQLYVCDMVVMELLHSAGTPELYAALREDLESVPWLYMDGEDWDRALEVQGLLAAKGQQLHRSVKYADLLIAACAERYDVALVHYDRDYDTIAGVTDQAMRWVAPPGSLDQPRRSRE
jgi:predicted nucleic acid-binding protein